MSACVFGILFLKILLGLSFLKVDTQATTDMFMVKK